MTQVCRMSELITRLYIFLEAWETCAGVLPQSVFVIVFADLVQKALFRELGPFVFKLLRYAWRLRKAPRTRWLEIVRSML